MTKIKTYPWTIGDRKLEFALEYSPKLRVFYINLPDWMAGVLEKKRLEGNTQFEVERQLHENVEEYGRRMTTEKKVIFYTFKSVIRPRDFRGVNEARGSSEMLSMGVALELWFEVGYILRDPTKVWGWDSEIYVDENHKRIPGGWFANEEIKKGYVNYMDYTEEREKFFDEFREWLVSGITRMKEFFADKKMLPMLLDDVMQGRRSLPFKEKD